MTETSSSTSTQSETSTATSTATATETTSRTTIQTESSTVSPPVYPNIQFSSSPSAIFISPTSTPTIIIDNTTNTTILGETGGGSSDSFMATNSFDVNINSAAIGGPIVAVVIIIGAAVATFLYKKKVAVKGKKQAVEEPDILAPVPARNAMNVNPILANSISSVAAVAIANSGSNTVQTMPNLNNYNRLSIYKKVGESPSVSSVAAQRTSVGAGNIHRPMYKTDTDYVRNHQKNQIKNNISQTRESGRIDKVSFGPVKVSAKTLPSIKEDGTMINNPYRGVQRLKAAEVIIGKTKPGSTV
jgi:hypothetical protein